MYEAIVLTQGKKETYSELYRNYNMDDAQVLLNGTVDRLKLEGYRLKKMFILKDNHGVDLGCQMSVLEKGFLSWKKKVVVFIKESTDYDNDKTAFELYEDLDRDISWFDS